jgi:CRISPR-associated endonuclease/helicase Cas3
VVMSATWSGGDRLGLGPDDLADPRLAPRLTRPKPFKLVAIDADADLARALVQEAKALRRQGAEVIAVVANTVREARAVFDLLDAEAETILLTGRVRPAERDALVAAYLSRMASGTRGSGRTPLYVVATQTIEVGADLDFDALVSESAPLSALLQRAGRLNRLGELSSAPLVVIHRALSDQEKKRRLHEMTRRARSHRSLYREQANDACKWMKKHKVKDFGIQAMARHPALAEPATPSPDLLAAHLDLLSWTSIRHGIDPPLGCTGMRSPIARCFSVGGGMPTRGHSR